VKGKTYGAVTTAQVAVTHNRENLAVVVRVPAWARGALASLEVVQYKVSGTPLRVSVLLTKAQVAALIRVLADAATDMEGE
jgi:hypothetical protein